MLFPEEEHLAPCYPQLPIGLGVRPHGAFFFQFVTSTGAILLQLTLGQPCWLALIGIALNVLRRHNFKEKSLIVGNYSFPSAQPQSNHIETILSAILFGQWLKHISG